MIKHRKINPVGVDKWIDRFLDVQQKELHDVFGINESECLFYGRTEIIDKKIVVYVSDSKYENVGFDSKKGFISYFLLDNTFRTNEMLQLVNASFYCHGDLSKIFPSIAHRADEEFRETMKDFVYRFVEPAEMGGTQIIKEQLQPYHSFIINFEISW